MSGLLLLLTLPALAADAPRTEITPKDFHERALAKPVPSASAKQTAAWLKSGEAVLLDLREKAAYDAGHLSGARSLPATAITDEALKAVVPSTASKVVVYCDYNLAPIRRIALTTLGAPAIAQLGYAGVRTLEPLWNQKDCLKEKNIWPEGCPGVLPWSKGFDYTGRVGTVFHSEDRLCVAVAKAGLGDKDAATLLSLSTSKVVGTAKLRREPACERHTALECKSGLDGKSFYGLSVDGGGDAQLSGVLAVIGPAAGGKGAGVDLDGDGKAEGFGACSGTEGLNTLVFSGEPFKSSCVWQDYCYLGHDVEPDCPARLCAP